MPDAIPHLPPRPCDGHKGDFGVVVVVGGCSGPSPVMLGAPVLAGLAALRSGAGRCVLAVPDPLVQTSLSLVPSATGWPLACDASGELHAKAAESVESALAVATVAVVGPGLGRSNGATAVVKAVLEWSGGPVVVDADAITVVAAHQEWVTQRTAPTILTPHGGECRRLMDALGLSGDVTDFDDRRRVAEELATALGALIVLKGAGTVVTDGKDTVVNATGSVTLATGGSGDVLAGVIGSIAGQWIGGGQGAMSMASAVAGTWVHGAAADSWTTRHGSAGLLATDLLAEIPGALATMPRG